MIEIGIIGGAILLALYLMNKEQAQGETIPAANNSTSVFSGGYYVDTGESTQGWLDRLYIEYGNKHGVEPRLLKAIAQVESSENPSAKNPADPSFGLMQIYCIDDGNGSCRNKLNVNDWPPASVERLLDPAYSLHIGAQILAWNISTYGLLKGIATYNNWSAHESARNGPFPNQSYVDKVIQHYNSLANYFN